MGGASVAIINMLTHLIQQGIIPMVTCPAEGFFSNELKKMGIPVKFIGVGEKIEDLQIFDKRDFVASLFRK